MSETSNAPNPAGSDPEKAPPPIPNAPPTLDPIGTINGLIILPPGPDYIIRTGGFGW